VRVFSTFSTEIFDAGEEITGSGFPRAEDCNCELILEYVEYIINHTTPQAKLIKIHFIE